MGRDCKVHRIRRSLALTGMVAMFSLAIYLAGCDSSGSIGVSQLDPPGDQPAFPFPEGHVDQFDITNGTIGFDELFFLGDELFEVDFNGLDGIGILQLPDGTPFPQRFSRTPPGGGRFTGPNGQSCASCHNTPFPTSAGTAAGNVIQDPSMTGVAPFNFRNTISLFASGVPQRLAEEMTEELQAARDTAAAALPAPGGPVVVNLTSKGVSFGSVSVSKDASSVVTTDTTLLEGVDPDLVVRPYGWKGDNTSLRQFTRGAAMNEMGMQATELVGVGVDDDVDGVSDELSVGDITAITIYIAAQEIPVPLSRLVEQNLAPPPTGQEASLIARGEQLFSDPTVGCAVCHTPEMQVLDAVFEEPTRRGNDNFLDATISTVATGYDPDNPFRFNLVSQGDFPRLIPHPSGGARVQLFSDLKRHNMGASLSDNQDVPVTELSSGNPLMVAGVPVIIDRRHFLTPELWGVGNSGPWMHDGRAGSLDEAIRLHGVNSPPPIADPNRSEAQESRDAYVALSANDQLALVEFLSSLVHFSFPEEEE